MAESGVQYVLLTPTQETTMSPSLGRFTRRVAVASCALLALGLVSAQVAAPGTARPIVTPVAADLAGAAAPADGAGLLGLRTIDVRIDARSPRQEWFGVGAALTDASVELLRANPRAMQALFDPTYPDGARLNLVRLPLSSTDFSPTPWTWDWDGQVAHPSPEAVAAATLLLQDIAPLVGDDLAVNAVAWSAPAEMKTSGSLRGGALREDAETAYGDMLVSQVRRLLEAGVPVRWLSLGNEPNHSADYATMTMTTEQQVRLAGDVSPRLDALGVDLLALDHNWSHRSQVDDLLSGAPQTFGAVGWHCYDGDHTQAGALGAPGVTSMITECTGTTDSTRGTFDWDSRNLVAGPAALGNGALFFLNLALDATHGPFDADSWQRCTDCRGLGRITSQGASPEPEYFVAAHLARAARPGSRYLPATSSDGRISVAAFRDPDGRVGVYAHNGTRWTRTVRFSDGSGSSRSVRIGAGDITSLRLPR